MSRLPIFLISYSVIQAYAAAQTTLNLSSTFAPLGGAVTLNLSLSSSAGSEPSGIQWTMNYPPAGLSNVSVVPGPALSSAGKSLQCEPGNGSYTCIAYGLNENIVANGVIAQVAVTPAASGTVAIGVNAVYAVSQTGNSESVTGFGGSITVTSSPAVSSVACKPQSLGPGSSAACTVTLTSAAGAVVMLSSNSTSLTVPASVTVAANATSANFTATSGAVLTAQSAVVTASVGSSSASTSLSLTPAATPAPAINSVACKPQSLGPGSSAVCTVTLTSGAGPGGAVVLLGSNSTSLTVPASVTVAANATSANFTATSAAVLIAQSAVVTASVGSSSASTSLSLTPSATPAPAMNSVACNPQSLGPGSSALCTVTLTSAAGAVVMLSSNSTSLTVPSSVTVAANATSANFTATSGAVLTAQSAVVTASVGSSSVSASLSLTPPATPAPAINSVACKPQSLGPGSSAVCMVTLTSAAGAVVTLSSNSTSLTVPASVTVAANATSANFIATSGAVLIAQSAVVTASVGSSSASASLSLTPSATPAPAMNSVTCKPHPLGPGSSTVCTFTLTSGAGPEGAVVLLSSNSTSLTVPASVTVPANATSANFTAVSGAVLIAQTAVATASLGSSSASTSLSLTPATAPSGNSNTLLLIGGTAGEVNGSVVTAVTPQGISGAAVVNGTGSINFVPGKGVYFQNCCAPTNNAYYKFTGAGLASVFGIPKGTISFTLTSRYNFAQRQSSASAQRYAFDARDGNAQHQFYFMTQTVGSYLVFNCVIGGVGMGYTVPQGTEDQVFGSGVSLNVAMKWGGGLAKLYLNGSLVSSWNYTPAAASWTDSSNFDLGAYEDGAWGGYNCLDDVIGNFSVTTPGSASGSAIVEIDGTSSEISGSLANGAAVTPESASNGVVGKVAMSGDGSVNFLSGKGVYFQNCGANSNAYYKFTGSGLGAVFGASQRQISFTLTSRYSFAQRQSSAAALRYAFDARDGNAQHQFYFMTQTVGSYLVFNYMVGGVGMGYIVPQGTEDQVFGSGVSLNVAMQWGGGLAKLYLNGSLVSSWNYTPAAASWTDASNFDLGAYEDGAWGGNNCSDDAIGNFKVSLPGANWPFVEQ